MTDDERAAVEELRRHHQDWSSAKGARDQCVYAADELLKVLPHAEKVCAQVSVGITDHVVVLLPSGAVVDLTAAQFGTPDEYPDLSSLLEHFERYRIGPNRFSGEEWQYRTGVAPPEPVEYVPPNLVPRRKRPGAFPRPLT